MSITYDQSSYDFAKDWITDEPAMKEATATTVERETDELAQVIQRAVEEHLESRRTADWKLIARVPHGKRRGW